MEGSRKGRKFGARLTEDNVREIRREYAAGGVTQEALALRFDVTQSTVNAVIRRHTWQGVEPEAGE